MRVPVSGGTGLVGPRLLARPTPRPTRGTSFAVAGVTPSFRARPASVIDGSMARSSRPA